MADSSARVTPVRSGGDDTRAIKARLLSVLGDKAEEYWAALSALCTAAINREEFQERVEAWLPEEYCTCRF